MRAPRCRMLLVAAVALSLPAGCALPPPPGAFFKWADVRETEIAQDRPLAALPVSWEALLNDSEALPGCDAARCEEEQAWFGRCVEPRAKVAAVAMQQHLISSGQWHPAAWASLQPGKSVSAQSPVCAADAQAQLAAAWILWALSELAAKEAPAACPALRLHELNFGLHEIDRSKESFGEWLHRDYPSIVGAAFGGIMTGAMAIPLGDIVSRVATLDLRFASSGDAPLQSAPVLHVHGGASVKIASGKVLEDEKLTPPPQLASVAFMAALGKLDAELQRVVAAACPPAAP